MPLIELKDILEKSKRKLYPCAICNKPVDDFRTGSYFDPVKLMMIHVAEFKCHGQIDIQESEVDKKKYYPFAEIAALRKAAYLVDGAK